MFILDTQGTERDSSAIFCYIMIHSNITAVVIIFFMNDPQLIDLA